MIEVRDSKDVAGPTLRFTIDEFAAFVTDIKRADVTHRPR